MIPLVFRMYSTEEMVREMVKIPNSVLLVTELSSLFRCAETPQWLYGFSVSGILTILNVIHVLQFSRYQISFGSCARTSRS